jgi:hypothetical protein
VSCSIHAALGALLVLVFGVHAAVALADARIDARVEPEIVDELETVRLVIRVSGATPGPIDVAPLAGDFEVLGTQTFNQYRSIAGAVESWVEYHIALRASRTGQLTIPPLTFGDATSEPLTLVVRPIDPAIRAAIDRMVFFEVELTRNPVYIRGETVLIRRLYYSDATQLYSDLPGPPDIPDTRVLPLGETRSATALRDGVRYGVIEQRFALFPERAAAVTVPSISLNTSVQLEHDGRSRRTGARVSTPPLALEVRPIPPAWPTDVPWLPATAVTLDDAWTPDGNTLTVGDSVERHVTITVRGNVAAAIAPPADELPERYFRQYPEPAALADDRAGDTVTGIRSTAYAIVPTEPGETRLADLAVTWWNVDRDALEVSRIPGRTVIIGGASPASPATASAAPAPEPGTEPSPRPSTGAEHDTRPLALERVLAGIAVAALLMAAGSLLLVPAGRRLAARAWTCVRSRWQRRLVQIGVAGAERGIARARHLQRLRRALASAGELGDPAGIERELAAYLACWYRLPEAAALATFRTTQHGKLLDRLQRARYARTRSAAPATTELMDALRAMRTAAGRNGDRGRRAARRDPLPHLGAVR